MKLNTALKICKSIGDSRYLDTEKLTAIKTVVTATSSARQLSIRDLSSMGVKNYRYNRGGKQN